MIVNKVGSVFLAIYSFFAFNTFTIDGYSFTLLDVFWAGVILSLIGIAIGKIYLFIIGRR